MKRWRIAVTAAALAASALAFQAMPTATRTRSAARQNAGGKSPVYADELVATFEGTVRTNNGKLLRVADVDGKVLEFHTARKTEYFDGERRLKAAEVKPGVRVSVDAKQFPDGELEPVSVRVVHETAKKPEKAADTGDADFRN